MSLVGQREEIASLLSTVEGVKGYRFRPTGLATGDGWPLLDVVTARRNGFQASWHVVILLPSDEEDASEWFDEKYEAIADALGPFATVEQVYPDHLATPEGVIEVMRLVLEREG